MSHVEENLTVLRGATFPGPQHDFGGAAAGKRKAEGRLENPADPAMGDAAFLVQVDGEGLGVGAELTRGGAQSVAGLELDEAALMGGCSRLQTLRWVILPLGVFPKVVDGQREKSGVSLVS